MSVKTIIDGSLLADCERHGQVRFGMFRVAEEITKRLVDQSELAIYLANMRQTVEDNNLLRAYTSKLHSTRKITLLSHPFNRYNSQPIQKIAARINRYFYPEMVAGIENYDLFHSFYFPFSENIKKANIKKSITLLDIIPLRMEGYTHFFNHMKAIVESIVPNSAIAISQFSKDDLCDYDKRIHPEQVYVVPLAANKELFFVNKNQEDWQNVQSKYGLPDNYFLSIAGFDKRKNLEHLIYSFDQLVIQENIGDLHLVMTGSLTYDNAQFQQLKIDPKTRKRIVLSRPIEESDLHIVYSNALCFFFMSVYEGFGLPVLEAMQCGVPVVTSNVTSIPEVVGNAGIMLPPDDKDALSSTMLNVYTDGQLRSDLSTRGLKRSQEYSWQRCADEYTTIFKKIKNS